MLNVVELYELEVSTYMVDCSPGSRVALQLNAPVVAQLVKPTLVRGYPI